tara:strand:+ start:851 stop:3421 length:2571 start_codon:yes stop_codon:yes gene_type:complete
MNKTLNNNATSLLAQYLARENLTVVHNATAHTASIDLANRVLELPTWDTSSVGAQAKPVYHGLVGHEVAHALHTPAKEWVEAQSEIAGVGSSERARAVAQDFVNVVEDARIEKIIKREFPGLKSDFAHMYDTMWKMDAFQCKAKDLNTMRFIDRLNLHYKVGIHAGVTVPFTDVERETIKRIDRAVSFRDVVDIAKDLYTAAQEEQQDEQGNEGKQSKPEDKKDGQKGKKGQPCDQGEKGESTKSEGESQDSDNQQDAEGDGNGNGSEGKENGEGSQSDGKDGQKSDADDADANAEKSSPDAEKQEIGEGNKSSDHTNADTDIVPYGCTTQQNMSKFVNGLVNVKIDEEPIRVPNIDPTSIVVEPADFIAMVEQGTLYTYYGGGKGPVATQEIAEQSAALFAEMTAKQKSAVDHMSRRFEMRKAAKDFARQSSCKSGRISTRQLSKYKFSEDIFDRLTIKRDEKNHGIVILLDWSGSMASMITDVVQQVGGILQFCRRVGIPAEVYFFNSMYNKWAEERFNKMYPAKSATAEKPTRPYAIRYGMADSAGFSGMDWFTAEAMAFTDHVCHLPNGSTAKGGNVILSAFSLVKVYDANMDNRKFAATFGRLLLVANAVGSKTMTAAKGNLVFPDSLQMGNTPLDESILSMREIVNNFRKSSNSKVTFISMSDGEGQGLTNLYHATTRGKMRQAEKNTKTVTTVLIDGSNGRRYENGKLDHGHCRDKTHSTCVQMFRDATGVEIAGIMMLQGNSSLSYTGMYMNNMPKGADYLAEAAQREKDQKQFQAEDFIAMPVNGYNSYFFVNVKSSTQVLHEQIKERKRLESLKNRKTAIEREMILNAEQSQCNRAFINRLMDIVA